MSVRGNSTNTREHVVDDTSSTCLTCGHSWAQHGGICTGAGWASWVARPCTCTAFPVGGWEWPTNGVTDCVGCGHAQAAHADGAHCRVAAEDERDDCRCASYRVPRAAEAFSPESPAEVSNSIRATSFRLYRILTSKADTTGNVTVTVNELRTLLPGPNGKPGSSLSRVRDALRELSTAGMVVKASGGAVTTSSRPAAADLPLDIRLLPASVAGSVVVR